MLRLQGASRDGSFQEIQGHHPGHGEVAHASRHRAHPACREAQVKRLRDIHWFSGLLRGAGESHVRGAKLLRWNENLILTVSPDSIGDLFGPLCRMLFAVGRSSEEPSTARFDRDAVHCASGHTVRSHDLLRHRAVWRSKEALCAQFLVLKHGVPSHDTFSRVFRILDPKSFESVFRRFTKAFATATKIKGVVALDGKALRRATNAAKVTCRQ